MGNEMEFYIVWNWCVWNYEVLAFDSLYVLTLIHDLVVTFEYVRMFLNVGWDLGYTGFNLTHTKDIFESFPYWYFGNNEHSFIAYAYEISSD